MASTSSAGPRSTVEILRSGLLAILVIGLVGTEAELFLLKHTDGWQALLPVVIIGVSLVVLAWIGLRQSAVALQVFRVLMLGFVVVGAVGVLWHYQANTAFEVEMNPSLGGSELFQMALAGATPTLAPGTFVQLGLVGLAYAFRHPVSLAAVARKTSPSSGALP
jgi:amino acid transporter